MNRERGQSYAERWIGRALSGLLLFGISALYYQLQGIQDDAHLLRVDVAVADAKISTMQKQIIKFEKRVADRYRGADAARDLSIVSGRLSDHEMRLRKVEKDHGRLPQLQKSPLHWKQLD